MTARPPIPNPPYQGGCLCGQVRYRLDARPATMTACHCDACKKLSGATNLLVVTAPRDQFHHLSGELQRFRRTADSGRQSDVVRCANCGTRLWHEPLSFPVVTLAAGTLDDPSWVVPASEIWVEKASPAAIFHSDATRFHGQPDRQAQVDAFNALYGEGA
ncbi:MAG: GFA family protein [Alphaproteobacteria bacterium]|nr:GFA family protein [Alphaproteobacteria bacterium]